MLNIIKKEWMNEYKKLKFFKIFLYFFQNKNIIIYLNARFMMILIDFKLNIFNDLYFTKINNSLS